MNDLEMLKLCKGVQNNTRVPGWITRDDFEVSNNKCFKRQVMLMGS